MKKGKGLMVGAGTHQQQPGGQNSARQPLNHHGGVDEPPGLGCPSTPRLSLRLTNQRHCPTTTTWPVPQSRRCCSARWPWSAWGSTRLPRICLSPVPEDGRCDCPRAADRRPPLAWCIERDAPCSNKRAWMALLLAWRDARVQRRPARRTHQPSPPGLDAFSADHADAPWRGLAQEQHLLAWPIRVQEGDL